MDPITLQLIVAAVTLALKYGGPAAMAIIEQWQNAMSGKNPTLDDIRALYDMPPPESFFPEKPPEGGEPPQG